MTAFRPGPSACALLARAGPNRAAQNSQRKQAFLAASTLLLLAGCDSRDTPTTAAPDTADQTGYKTAGTFVCRPGHAIQAVQITSTADVPAGASMKISVQTPPVVPAQWTPERMNLFCQADEQRCTGTSCNGNPPVDFIGNHGDGLTWESTRSETGESKTVFSAMVHNSDAMAHHVTLTLDLPAQ